MMTPEIAMVVGYAVGAAVGVVQSIFWPVPSPSTKT